MAIRRGVAAPGLFPWQIKAHHRHAVAPGHQRVTEYLQLHPHAPVPGLPEGDWIEVRDRNWRQCGPSPTMQLRHGQTPRILPFAGSLDAVIRRADSALYRAKSAGRDRIAVSGTEPKVAAERAVPAL